jgi:hypothetical protein
VKDESVSRTEETVVQFILEELRKTTKNLCRDNRSQIRYFNARISEFKARVETKKHDIRFKDNFAMTDFDIFSDFINVLKRKTRFSVNVYQSTRAVT